MLRKVSSAFPAARHNNNSRLVGICRIISHSPSITMQRIFTLIYRFPCLKIRIFSWLGKKNRFRFNEGSRPFHFSLSTARENGGFIDRLRAEPTDRLEPNQKQQGRTSTREASPLLYCYSIDKGIFLKKKKKKGTTSWPWRRKRDKWAGSVACW